VLTPEKNSTRRHQTGLHSPPPPPLEYWSVRGPCTTPGAISIRPRPQPPTDRPVVAAPASRQLNSTERTQKLLVGYEYEPETASPPTGPNHHIAQQQEQWILPPLEILNLGYNRLTGSIPSNIGTARNLRELVLCQNQLTGTIPTCLSNLTLLSHFGMYSLV
jgi:Leucine rich repeat